MGRRFLQNFANKREIITYHVYVNDVYHSSFVQNLEAAQSVANSLEGTIEIRKTRETVDK